MTDVTLNENMFKYQYILKILDKMHILSIKKK